MKRSNVGAIRALINETPHPLSGPDFLSSEAVRSVYAFHTSLADYCPTPLVRLDGLARKLGVKAVFVKDESRRFGLNAFKGLGGLYSLTRVICQELGLDAEQISFQDLQTPERKAQIQDMVFVTATDGNHGKGVAWAAGLLGCQSYIFMPKGSSPLRAEAIRAVGKAQVEIMEVGYDDAVRHAADMARIHGWHLVQDTSWPGYETIPAWIIQGYTTMGREAVDQLREAGFAAPTHVFLQAGVGAMAGGILGYLVNQYSLNRPTFSIVEPENMACIYRSAQVGDGAPHPAVDTGDTIMAGLNCGEPCTITWPILRDHADWYFACPDYISAHGMRLLAAPQPGDLPIVSGESGAVTTGLVDVLATRSELRELREQLGLDTDSVILLFSTEGDTDPVRYRQIVEEGYLPLS